MPKKRKQTYKGNSIKKNILLFLLAIGILLLISFIAKKTDTRISQIAQTDSLQLGTFHPSNAPLPTKTSTTKAPTVTKKPLTPTVEPTPGTCAHDIGRKIHHPDCLCYHYKVQCTDDGKCLSVENEGYRPPITCADVERNDWCNPHAAGEGAGTYCMGKPIIYLYPEKPTVVDVKIETTGNIFISDPLYPDGGWKNVLAYPNGNLTYQGKNYRELFYETDVDDFEKPTNGINIPREQVEPELKRILTQLGLNEWERGEFLEFWVPILKNQEKPHIMFSLIQGKAKERIDKVIINPKPNTFIEILAYFKPLDKPFQGPNLKLPNNPPKRVGFTAVEWGGTVDNK